MRKSFVPLGMILLAWMMLLAGCSTASDSNVVQLSEELFPKDKVIEVNLAIDADDYRDMLEHPTDKKVKAASVQYNGYELDNIGIRTKGNSSLTGVASSDSDRYSLKLLLDEYIDSQNLLGVTSINLNNGYSDPSFIREYLTYELLEEMGLPAPEFAFANVSINGEPAGLFLAVEQINESFLSRNFDTSYGVLYKPDGQGSDLSWRGDDISSYSGLNRKSKSSDDELTIRMLDELNNGTEYEKYLNVDGILRYMAVNAATVNMDSYQGNFNHNYYLYEENGVFSLIPWDMNMAFGGFGGSKESLIGMLMDEPTMGAVANYPLVDKLLQIDAYKEQYHNYIKQIIEGYLSPERLTARAQEIADMIDTYVEQDPTKFYTYEEFKQSLTNDVKNIPGLLAFAEDRVNNLKQQLDGTLPSYDKGEGIQGGMPGRGGMREQGSVAGENPGGGGPANPDGGAPPDAGQRPPTGGEGQDAQNGSPSNPGEGGAAKPDAGAMPDAGQPPTGGEGQDAQNGAPGNPGGGGQATPGGGAPPDADQQPPDFGGKRPDMGNGQMPINGGGRPGGNREQDDAAAMNDRLQEAITVGIVLLLLIGAIFFVRNYKKRSL
ncbi:spore coat assembly protein [Paenibacillus dendritiformis]|nr:spore coat assembly protein [Paenibacillus dendritiformis]